MNLRRTPVPLSISLLVTLLVAGCGSLLGLDSTRTRTPPRRELVIPGESHLQTFDNGLTVLVVPDPRASVLRLEVRYGVGQRDGSPARNELANFVGRLMLELPSDDPGSDSIGATMAMRALEVGTSTSLDETKQTIVGAPEDLATFLRYAAQGLGADCEAIDEASFVEVRKALTLEHDRGAARADLRLADQIVSALYPEGHPYRIDRTSAPRSFEDLTRATVCAFMRDHFTTDRTTLVVTGPVDIQETLELVTQEFDVLPRRPAAPPRARVSPIDPLPERIVLRPETGHAQAYVLFPAPPRFGPNATASWAAWRTIELAVSISLDQTLGTKGAWSFVELGGKAAPLPGIMVQTHAQADLEPALDEVFASIERIFSMELTTDALDRVKDSWRLQSVGALADAAARPSEYANYLDEGDSPGFIGGELDRIDALSSAEVLEAGRRAFGRHRATLVVIRPKRLIASSPIDLDLEAFRPSASPTSWWPAEIDPARAEQAIDFEIGSSNVEIEELEFLSGMKVVLVRSSEFPVMDARFILSAGRLHARGNQTIPELASHLYLRHEWQSLPMLQFFSESGGSLQEHVSLLHTRFRSQGLSIYFDLILSSLSEHVVHHEYRWKSFEKWKEDTLTATIDPRVALDHERQEILFDTLYGRDHAFANLPSDRSRIPSLQQVELFHRRHYVASNSTLIVTGGFDMDRIEAHVRATLERSPEADLPLRWSVAEPKGHSAVPPIDPAWGQVVFETDEESARTQLSLVYPFGRVYGPHHARLLVLAEMLQHQLDARAANLDTYDGIHVGLGISPPMLAISAAVSNEGVNASVATLRAAVATVTEGPEVERRFVLARRRVLASLIRAEGDPHRLAAALTGAWEHAESVDYFHNLAWQVGALNLERLREQARTTLPQQQSVVVLRGPTSSIHGVTSVEHYNDLPPLEARPH